MSGHGSQPKSSEVDRIVALAETGLGLYLGDRGKIEADIESARRVLPAQVLAWLQDLVSRPDSYRDALLVALAVPLVRGRRVDIRRRTEGGRAASDRIGRLLPEYHIKGVRSAYQNIGKNQPDLVRGNNPAFDNLLTWGAQKADLKEVRSAYQFVLAHVAATARAVLPCPNIRLAKLTFGRVMGVFEQMLHEQSGGAHEQFIVAALLEAALTQEGSSRRVVTKGVSASDRSAKAAGDVEIYERGRLLEGIEVSARPWADKVAQAEEALRSYGLPRAHVIANVRDAPDTYEEVQRLSNKDISVLDVRAVVATVTALLDRRGREFALVRLYELLDENVASPDLVNRYVHRLEKHGLAE